ncbi:MAG: 50S ribosomal protein L21 [Micavibrio aeruginosavorus]|uniref:Large ribosomal subunit protein bL21 n=1 Tax=Micavibrio aeruginosavorus TaxID=349221 RepID=A0A2W5FL18_9BACT|nr:MAG: 50S ribosomal protein L21 [Micavibrio aeruginosavorus]
MYAIIKTGGKQYKVQKDLRLTVEKLEGNPGDTIDLGKSLFHFDGDKATAQGSTITAEIVEHTRGDKILIFKKRRRQNSRRKNGHRQSYTTIKIIDIKAA